MKGRFVLFCSERSDFFRVDDGSINSFWSAYMHGFDIGRGSELQWARCSIRMVDGGGSCNPKWALTGMEESGGADADAYRNYRLPSKWVDIRRMVAWVRKMILRFTNKDFSDGAVTCNRLANDQISVQRAALIDSFNNCTCSLAANSALRPFKTQSDISHRAAVQKQYCEVVPPRSSAR